MNTTTQYSISIWSWLSRGGSGKSGKKGVENAHRGGGMAIAWHDPYHVWIYKQ